MNKRVLFIILILLGGNVAALILLPQTTTLMDREDLHIAVAVPLSGPESARGREVLNGIRLYLDRVASEGLLGSKRVKLVPYDDRKDRKTALHIATRIVEENKALLVLGHFYSSSAAIAGTVYRKRGIPAITGSATADSISLENDWYFSVIPNNHYISAFTAEYLSRGMGYTSASILYDQSAYGESLASGFLEKAQELDLKINGNWSFDTEDNQLNDRLGTITAQLRAMDDPGMIFCATYPKEGVKVLARLIFPGTPYRVIGPDTFASPEFLENLKAYPKEQIAPGYHSNGIFTVSPFLTKIAGEKGYRFQKAYVEKYRENPSWMSASYYDAIQVAVQAIENAELQGENLKEDRRRVRDALKGLNDERVAVDGITGNIYFDSQGNCQRPLSVGVYSDQDIRPAFLQYQKSPNGQSKLKTDNGGTASPIEIDGQMLFPTQVVYGGVRIIEIRDLDLAHSTFSADFLVWFRFVGEFDAARIYFPDAISPIQLEQPIAELEDKGMTVRAYRVTASFKSRFDYGRFPFDDQELPIRFRHQSLLRSDLLLVPDPSGLPDVSQLRENEKAKTFVLPGWKVSGLSIYQDTAALEGESRDAESGFSRLNADIHMHRAAASYVLRIFLPMLALALLFTLSYWLPLERYWMQAGFILMITAMGILLQWTLAATMERGYLQSIFTAFYGIACVTAAVVAAVRVLHQFGLTRSMQRVRTIARIAHPVLILAAAYGATMFYWR